MLARSLKTSLTLLLAGVVVGDQALVLRAQEIAPPAASAPAADAPAVPKGVEVLARGPVHEAFASLTTEAAPTKPVGKQPPKPLDEMPPAEKPEGDVVWIGGYWAYDDDRNDFLWVSGTWRATPPGKQWVAGYWREDDGKWQWVAGFWNTPAAKEKDQQDVTYLPQPPALPQVALPGEAPNAESFYVPGHWVWKGDRYGWQSGYWGKVEPGYVWVAGHYSWTPGGYVYVGGYWDYAVSKRGILYAPVYIDRNVVAVGYVYTPCYAVRETIVVDSLFVRPSRCHYYFGDYYGVEYRDMGYQSCVVYSRDHYDSIIVYERYEHRREPDWVGVQINVYNDRYEHRDSRPPRTLVQQNTIINNTTIINNNNTVINNNNSVKTVNNTNNVLAPATQVAAAKGVRTVPVDNTARVQAQQQAVAVQQVSVQRAKSEVAAPGGAPTQPRVASLTVPQQQPIVTKPVAPAVVATPATTGGVKATPAPGATSAPATTGVKPATTGTTPTTTTTTAVKSPAATTAMTPAATTTPVTSAGIKPLPTGTATLPATTTTTGTTAPKPPAAGTGTTPTTTTTTAAPIHPAAQLQPVVAPPPGSPFGSGVGAKAANPPATTTANGPPAKTTATGQPAVQPPAAHPNPPAKPVDPPRKPVPPKDKENKDKDKDRP